ncbi:hypothetical protein BSR28_08735, partial [Boudabousia liubingyangii]|uniref:hypothetical protein n=1 Tax=Boudabousia liubingyangii TaxID=1921764 RepID=UPI00096545C9
MSRFKFKAPGRRHSAVPVAAALVASLGIIGLPQVAPSAQAFVPASITPGNPTDPTITASLTHAPNGKDKPGKGETFTYTGTLEFGKMTEEGVTRTVSITVSQDSNAPFISAPKVEDFSGLPDGAKISGPKVSGDGSWTFEVANFNKDATVTFTKQATVKADVADGTAIFGSISANVKAVPTMKVQEGQGVVEPNTCNPLYTFNFKIPNDKPGAWLSDIKIAATNQSGNMSVDSWTAKDSKIVVKRGELIETLDANNLKLREHPDSEVTATVVYNDNDTTPPYVPNPLLSKEEYPNLKWLDSANWEFDAQNLTGRVWLPSGTEIQVQRRVNLDNCKMIGGIAVATDGKVLRSAIALSFPVTRPQADVDAYATDAFVLPGGPVDTSNWCDNIIWNVGGKAENTKDVEWFSANGVDSAKYAGPGINAQAGNIAISKLHKDKLFYIGTDYNLYEREVSGGTPKKVSLSRLPVSYAAPSVGIDPFGILWVFGANTMFGKQSNLWSFDINNPSEGWKKHNAVSAGWDLAFSPQGDLVIVTLNTSSTDKFFTFEKYDRAEILKDNKVTQGLGSSLAHTDTYFKSPGNTATFNQINGLGIDKNGNAYVSDWQASSLVKLSFPATKATGNDIEVVSKSIFVPQIVDMGSCNFIEQEAPGGKKVRKLAIDPLSGEIVQPKDPSQPSRSTNRVTLKGDGSATIRYAIQVTNLGEDEDSKSTTVITDDFSAPDGFELGDVTIKKNGYLVAERTSDKDAVHVSYVFEDVPFKAHETRTYIVTIDLKAKDGLASLTQSQGDCESSSTPGNGLGFVNNVTIQGEDSDGEKNNEACIPWEKPENVRLTLKKRVVRQDGSTIDEGAEDSPLSTRYSDYFRLIAAPEGSVDPVAGIVTPPEPGFSVVDGYGYKSQQVVPGTYKLTEMPGKETNEFGFFQYEDWSCAETNGSGDVVAVSAKDTIEVKDKDVTCVVVNTLKPKFKVEKFASNGEHVGAAIEPNAQGKLSVVYKVDVTNLSNFEGNIEGDSANPAVKDLFVVPAGLKWDGSEKAKVTYAGAGEPAGVPTDGLTETQLSSNATLATSINNIPAGAKGTFTITIPLVVDNTVADNGKTVFENNVTKLGECESMEVDTQTVTKNGRGILNQVSLANESMTYPGKPVRDNIACNPVKPKTSWRVEKAAKSGTGWAEAGTAAPTVEATQADKKINNFEVTADYKITVTNNGPTSGTRPAITDNVTLPAGTKWELRSIEYQLPGKTDWVVVPSQQGTSFEIPAGETSVGTNKSESILVRVKAHIINPTKTDWEKAGECRNDGAGTPGTGFFNTVTYAGDTDGVKNNDACVPVKHTPGEFQILIRKTDDTGKFYLRGAEFKICEDNPNSNPNAVCSSPLPLLKDNLGNCEVYPVDSLLHKACKAQFSGANDPTNKSLATFVSNPLKARNDDGTTKFYWLVETKAPECVPENKGENGKEYCASLLPQPLKFSVNSDGVITPFDGAGKLVEGRASSSQEVCNPTTDANCDPTTCLKPVDDTFYVFNGLIKVHDPRRGELPISGGTGPMPYALAAG